jgi:hypothetical protein
MFQLGVVITAETSSSSSSSSVTQSPLATLLVLASATERIGISSVASRSLPEPYSHNYQPGVIIYRNNMDILRDLMNASKPYSYRHQLDVINCRNNRNIFSASMETRAPYCGRYAEVKCYKNVDSMQYARKCKTVRRPEVE